jgi:hypothetical protein
VNSPWIRGRISEIVDFLNDYVNSGSDCHSDYYGSYKVDDFEEHLCSLTKVY